MPGGDQQVALVGLEMEQMEPLGRAVQALSAALQANLAEESTAVTYARSRSRSWGERSELCDLGEFAQGLAESATAETVRDAAQGLVEALDAAVVGRWWSGDVPARASAVGIYFPRTLETVPVKYPETFELVRESGWGSLLQAYWGRIAGLVDGGAIH
jgi:hypothetical protein